ncbi:hypothetical protein F7725_023928 [Dissostichus mawsoni]|uniref:Uncharacterized protein n=1 Tax=Dissostichus mawsoni TaxID=36200 RepID=A0A7J5XZT3_DISMA|nr:hypothetical protein F7725_023928 [Dissostichus mawsoni]
METNSREALQEDYDAFDISDELGFILEEPLNHLPDHYQIPVLSPNLLSNHRELRLAHIALGFISMGYILPKALAFPYWLVSDRLGLPAILTYADSVLCNWKLRDPTGVAGDFLLYCTALVEMAASSGITLIVFKNSNHGALEVMHTMNISDLSSLQRGLVKVTQSLKKMKETFKHMHSKFELTWSNLN